MSHVDEIEAFLRERRERLGDEEKERQRGLRYCDGTKERYAHRMGFKSQPHSVVADRNM